MSDCLGLQAQAPPRAPAREPMPHHAGCAAPTFEHTPPGLTKESEPVRRCASSQSDLANPTLQNELAIRVNHDLGLPLLCKRSRSERLRALVRPAHRT